MTIQYPDAPTLLQRVKRANVAAYCALDGLCDDGRLEDEPRAQLKNALRAVESIEGHLGGLYEFTHNGLELKVDR